MAEGGSGTLLETDAPAWSAPTRTWMNKITTDNYSVWITTKSTSDTTRFSTIVTKN